MIVTGRRHWWQKIVHPGAVLVAPAFILYTAFFVWPAIQALGVSMYDWTGFAPKMKFYDLKGKKAFQTDKYKMVSKSGRNFAVATAPSGSTAWRIMGKK